MEKKLGLEHGNFLDVFHCKISRAQVSVNEFLALKFRFFPRQQWYASILGQIWMSRQFFGRQGAIRTDSDRQGLLGLALFQTKASRRQGAGTGRFRNIDSPLCTDYLTQGSQYIYVFVLYAKLMLTYNIWAHHIMAKCRLSTSTALCQQIGATIFYYSLTFILQHWSLQMS